MTSKPLTSSPSYNVPRGTPSLADAEAVEDGVEQLDLSVLAGDVVQRAQGAADLAGHHLEGADVERLLRAAQRLDGPPQGLAVPLGGEGDGLHGVGAEPPLQLAPQRIEALARDRADRQARSSAAEIRLGGDGQHLDPGRLLAPRV